MDGWMDGWVDGQIERKRERKKKALFLEDQVSALGSLILLRSVVSREFL